MAAVTIQARDIDLEQAVGLAPADGWFAEYSVNEKRRVLFWVLLRDGGIVGIVPGSPDAGGNSTMNFDARAADKILNFSGYHHA